MRGDEIKQDRRFQFERDVVVQELPKVRIGCRDVGVPRPPTCMGRPSRTRSRIEPLPRRRSGNRRHPMLLEQLLQGVFEVVSGYAVFR
jgi:hypothetical protein